MRTIHASDLMGFTIIEPTYTQESEPGVYEIMDLTDIPGVAEASSIDEVDAALADYFARTR